MLGPEFISHARGNRRFVEPASAKATVNVLTGLSLCLAIRATSRDESIPPERNTPIGTSLTICRDTSLQEFLELLLVWRLHRLVGGGGSPIAFDSRLFALLGAIRIGCRARASERLSKLVRGAGM